MIIAVLQGGCYLYFKYEKTEAQSLFKPMSSFESHALSPSSLCSSEIYFLHRTCFPPGQLGDEPCTLLTSVQRLLLVFLDCVQGKLI